MQYQPSMYTTNSDNSCRYVLGTKGIKPLIVIGINPSKADEKIPDNTIKKVMGFAEGNGFDSFIMLNLYPQRTPFPCDLHSEIDENISKENFKYISETVNKYDQPTILVAWSEKITLRNYLNKCASSIIEIIGKENANWIKIGELTKSGHPRHPLYAGYHLALTEFNLSDYLARSCR